MILSCVRHQTLELGKGLGRSILFFTGLMLLLYVLEIAKEVCGNAPWCSFQCIQCNKLGHGCLKCLKEVTLDFL